MTNRTKEEQLLPDDLVWAHGGHASDVVLTALADGQLAIVPPSVIAHVGECRACTTHLGNAALLSLHTGQEIAMVARDAHATARPPMPRLAIAVALVVAVVGLVPSVLDAPSELGSAKTFATRELPMFASGLGTLGRRLLDPATPIGLALTYGASALLVLMAFALVRLLPNKEVSR